MRYTDGYWWSKDNLRLHYRDYHGPADRPPILCLPGLTRNARDFDGLAAWLSPDWRVIAVDFRGRGESAYAKDPMSYAPLIYVQDVEALLATLGLDRIILFGTSLGGLVAMILAGAGHARLAAATLNDIGPASEPEGLARIRGNVGRSESWPTWVHAARALGETNAEIHPRFMIEEWIGFAKRTCRLTPSGRIVTDYDRSIAEPFRLPGGDGSIDAWPALKALVDVPTLIVRGERSDVLSATTAAAMTAQLRRATVVTIADTGHAPTLDEPEARAAIATLLQQVA